MDGCGCDEVWENRSGRPRLAGSRTCADATGARLPFWRWPRLPGAEGAELVVGLPMRSWRDDGGRVGGWPGMQEPLAPDEWRALAQRCFLFHF